ncbi:MAG: hypothetical protein ABJJ43_00135 [Ekhidna sp.]
MTHTPEKNSKSKRRRGRPKGSSRFAESDKLVCEKAADFLIKHPSSRPVISFKKQGYQSESELHRLREKFRSNKEQFMKDAKARHLATVRLGTWGEVGSIIQDCAEWVDTMLNSAPVMEIRDDLALGLSKQAALKRLELQDTPPFDVKDPEEIASAIESFENREFKTGEDFAEGLGPRLTTEEMPQSARYYSMALCFYSMFQDAEDREKKEGSTS